MGGESRIVPRSASWIRTAAEAQREGPLAAAEAAVNRAAANLATRTRLGALAVKPLSKHWQRFIADARQEVQSLRAEALSQGEADAGTVAEGTAAVDAALNIAETACVNSEANAHQAATAGLGQEADMFAQVAFTAAVQQGSAAVVAALQASVVDGPRTEHPGAAEIRGVATANPLWTELVFGR